MLLFSLSLSANYATEWKECMRKRLVKNCIKQQANVIRSRNKRNALLAPPQPLFSSWPALSRNPPSTSTPAPPKNSKQAAGTKTAPPTPLPRTKRPAQASKYSDSVGIPLKNRFSALQPEPLSENPPSNINNEAKPSHPPHTLSPKDKVTTRKTKGMQRVLIVGDETVNGISHVCNPKKTRVVSFLGDTVSDLTRKVLSLTADQPNMETLVVHVGANDLAKQKSEILKKDFNILLDTMGKLKMKLFLSGPIPSPQWGDEKHSRLGMINKWLIKTCSASSVTFIDNLWIYWQRFHLFGRGGRNLNKHGIRLRTLPVQITRRKVTKNRNTKSSGLNSNLRLKNFQPPSQLNWLF
uniref:SGNH hydrolase-type esterase domain-containing protein n=1 Tax=Poecilia latipinna TaxID=48699 RepID=A0A3B3V7E0_9TELE